MQDPEPTWTCPDCGGTNTDDKSQCGVCLAFKPLVPRTKMSPIIGVCHAKTALNNSCKRAPSIIVDGYTYCSFHGRRLQE